MSEQASISTLQKRLRCIYTNNAQRSEQEIFAFLCRAIGYLGKNVDAHLHHRSSERLSDADFLRPISWLLGLADKYDIQMQAAFFARYPRACPHCVAAVCVCHKTGKVPQFQRREGTPDFFLVTPSKMKEELGFKFNLLHEKNLDLDFAAECISTVYPLNAVIWEHGGPWKHFVKLWEEVSEVHEIMSQIGMDQSVAASTQESFGEEMADVLAWILAIWNHFGAYRSLSAAFSDYYNQGCPACQNEPCRCTQYAGRLTNLFDFTSTSRLRTKISSLIGEDPKLELWLRSSLNAIDEVEAAKSDSMARVTLQGIANCLASAKATLEPNAPARVPLDDLLKYIETISR